jgi:NADPH oxidase
VETIDGVEVYRSRKLLNKYVPLGKNITFHRYIAYFIAFNVAVHTAAHYANCPGRPGRLSDLSVSHSKSVLYGAFVWARRVLNNQKWRFPARADALAAEQTAGVFNTDATRLLIGMTRLNEAWLTGVAIIICMVFIFSAAQESVKRACFNSFWFSHHLFVVFWLMLLIHGPRFWIWSCVPLVLYFFGRVKRASASFNKVRKTPSWPRSWANFSLLWLCSYWNAWANLHLLGHLTPFSPKVILEEVVIEPPNVIKLVMCNKYLSSTARHELFNYDSGMYVKIKCPFVSPLEWHPFTISSAPESPWLTVHIKVTRPTSWTGKLKTYLGSMNPQGMKTCVFYDEHQTDLGVWRHPEHDMPILQVDGPHSAPCQHIQEFDHVILVGAGIGLTPFASTLCSLIDHKWAPDPAAESSSTMDLRSAKASEGASRLKSVYLHWSFRMTEFTNFRWFVSLLSEVRARFLAQNGSSGRVLEIHLYDTSPGMTPEKMQKNAGDILTAACAIAPVSGYNRHALIRVEATADYPVEGEEAPKSGQLHFKAGDRIKLISSTRVNAWIEGEEFLHGQYTNKRNGYTMVGWFPRAKVKLISNDITRAELIKTLNRMFRDLDRDGDGVLSCAEVTEGLLSQRSVLKGLDDAAASWEILESSQAGNWRKLCGEGGLSGLDAAGLVRVLDTNRDGSITKQEFFDALGMGILFLPSEETQVDSTGR